MGGIDLELAFRQADVSEGFEDIGEYHHVGCNGGVKFAMLYQLLFFFEYLLVKKLLLNSDKKVLNGRVILLR